jgi:hypothetical protein
LSIARPGRKNAFSGRDRHSAPFASKHLAGRPRDLAFIATKLAIHAPYRFSHYSFQQKLSYRGLKRPSRDELDSDDKVNWFESLAVHGDVADRRRLERARMTPCESLRLAYSKVTLSIKPSQRRGRRRTVVARVQMNSIAPILGRANERFDLLSYRTDYSETPYPQRRATSSTISISGLRRAETAKAVGHTFHSDERITGIRLRKADDVI